MYVQVQTQRDKDVNVAKDADIDTDVVANTCLSHAKEQKKIWILKRNNKEEDIPELKFQ